MLKANPLSFDGLSPIFYDFNSFFSIEILFCWLVHAAPFAP